ncbi:hypothetical protein R1X32_09895 (plasmid) [Rhodococcus opacus]|uniref:hypothetical protein n=1 Tax=Rhodococcus opacus TaxID=37919 RepID=UPI0034D29700
MWINKSGQIMGYGTWKNYESIRHHPRFAGVVGRDHQSNALGFALADLDLETFWSVVLRCAEQINGGRWIE